jgi:hypothetical protein
VGILIFVVYPNTPKRFFEQRLTVLKKNMVKKNAPFVLLGVLLNVTTKRVMMAVGIKSQNSYM